ncbi:MAG: hypothetical protein L6Q71_12405 [Planctomycetes bacterium]|nr:hypothetical protein [Planctomycetota bacterium]
MPDPVRRLHRDGGGGGGGAYTPQHGQQEGEQPHDEADISEEARKQAHMLRGSGQPDDAGNRLEILSEIQTFNEHHERSGSRLKALLKPGPQNITVLHVEDPVNAVSLTPFGVRDIYHFSQQEVRTRLQAFDKSSGSILDTKG